MINIKKNIVIKGFRPGKVPREILQKQFGKQILSEVLDKVLRETSMKALEEKKIKPINKLKAKLFNSSHTKNHPLFCKNNLEFCLAN